jgi:SAM-dependent methyltransferase
MQKSLISRIYQNSGHVIDFAGSGLTVLNLGAGKTDFPGVTAVDWVKFPNVKIVHNLEEFPWPIADNSVDVVMAFHFMEHTADMFKTFSEINRICKNGARVLVEVPHFRNSNAHKDPTHKQFITTRTMNYFCKNNHTYSNLPFTMELVDMSVGWPAHNSKNPIKRFLKNWFKNHPNQYDNWLYHFFMCNLLVFEFEIKK